MMLGLPTRSVWDRLSSRSNDRLESLSHMKVSRSTLLFGGIRGMTMVELIMVVTMIGVLTAVVIMRIGPESLGRPGVRATARRLGLDLRHARSLAVTEQTNHYVRFDATGYTIYRRDTPSDVAVDVRRTFPKGMSAAPTASDFEFEPTGAALASYTCDLSGSGVTYRVNVIGATGTTTVSEL